MSDPEFEQVDYRAVKRAQQRDFKSEPEYPEHPAIIDARQRKQDIATLAADILRLVVNTNGGIPGTPGGQVGRQIVREVRALYEEVDTPTIMPSVKRAGGGNRVARTAGRDDEEADGPYDQRGVLDEFEEGEL